MKAGNGKYTCCHCGDLLDDKNFYSSFSPFYQNGKLPICKKCFIRNYVGYLNIYHSSKKAMQRMCMAFDIYFNEKLFDSCDTTDNEKVIGNYFRQLNMTQHRNKTFDQTIEDGGVLLSGERVKVKEKRVALLDEYGNESDDEYIKPEVILRWGTGLAPTDYANLEAHYNYLKKSNPHCDSNQEIFIQDLCYAKMQQLKCVASGDMDGYKKMGEYYNNTFQKSGLKVANEGEANSDDCLGVWNLRIAQFTPEEYYKNKKLYSDYDSIRDYFRRFILRPLRNLQYGTTERDEEFYVKDVDEDDYADTEST